MPLFPTIPQPVHPEDHRSFVRKYIMRLSSLFFALPIFAQVDFNTGIQPILAANCYACHGPAMQMASLRLDQPDTARALLSPGHSGRSRLFAKISTGAMPPDRKLPGTDIATIRQWIDQGANWPQPAASRSAHPLPWSFRPLIKPPAPIGLAATKPEAPPAVLLRRVYLDLIGLPPAPDQIAGHRGQPFEKIVDSLLSSPRFGEKWATHWLDLARYSDSEGGSRINRARLPGVIANGSSMPSTAICRSISAATFGSPTLPGASSQKLFDLVLSRHTRYPHRYSPVWHKPETRRSKP